ncbi:hypothetical protein KKF55_01620 [Patescibacteria group bacterium]|nr:hypothetical protein [Patescibacteria group bacterium]
MNSNKLMQNKSHNKALNIISILIPVLMVLGFLWYKIDHVLEPPRPSLLLRGELKDIQIAIKWSGSNSIHVLNGLGDIINMIRPREDKDEWINETFSGPDLFENTIVAISRVYSPNQNKQNYKVLASPTEKNELTIYSTMAPAGVKALTSVQWSPSGDKVAFINWISQSVIVASLPSGEIISETKFDKTTLAGHLQWIDNRFIGFWHTYIPPQQMFEYAISKIDTSTSFMQTICEGINNRSELLSTWKQCSDSPLTPLLIGDREKLVENPIWAPNNNRFYFYTKGKEDPPLFKAWVEGYDRKTGKVFHVRTYETVFPYFP